MIDFSIEDGKQLELQKSTVATFKITNHLTEEFNGLISLYMSNNGELDSLSCYAGSFFVSIPAGSTIIKKTAIVPGVSGKVTLFSEVSEHIICQWNCTVVDNTTAVSLQPGIYIVDKKKVLVR